MAVSSARRFILQNFTQPLDRACLLDADKLGATCAESEALAAPLPRNSLRDLYWRLTRASMGLGKNLSDGVKLGFDTGFDSGSTLDYVYRNKPTGKGGLGRMIDTNYLNSIGWRGIRQRKLNVEELLRLAMIRLRDEQREVRIVDIAAGHGRYILEALQVCRRCRSRSCCATTATSTRDGGALIREKGLGISRSSSKAMHSTDWTWPHWTPSRRCGGVRAV